MFKKLNYSDRLSLIPQFAIETCTIDWILIIYFSGTALFALGIIKMISVSKMNWTRSFQKELSQTNHSTWHLIRVYCSTWHYSLRKHAYSNIKKISSPKTENFQIKISDIFHISAQNVDCGYSLEPPRRGGSNEYHNLCFWAEIRKIMYTPVNPIFTI